MCDINTTYGWDRKKEAKSFLDNLHKFGVVAFIQLHSPTDIRVYQCANVSIEYTIRFNQFIRPKLKSSRLVYSGFWIFNDISIQWWIVSVALNFPWVSQNFATKARTSNTFLGGFYLYFLFLLWVDLFHWFNVFSQFVMDPFRIWIRILKHLDEHDLIECKFTGNRYERIL